jgi:hypothetical protein
MALSNLARCSLHAAQRVKKTRGTEGQGPPSTEGQEPVLYWPSVRPMGAGGYRPLSTSPIGRWEQGGRVAGRGAGCPP